MIQDSLDSPYIHSANTDNFAAMVLENSHAGPVLATLAEIIEIEPGFNEDYARKAMLKIFTLIAAEDELISQYRPLLRRYKY